MFLWQSCNVTELTDYLTDHSEIKQLIADYVLTLLIGNPYYSQDKLCTQSASTDYSIINWSLDCQFLISEACRRYRLHDTTLQSIRQGTESLGRRFVCEEIWHWHTSTTTSEDPFWYCVRRSRGLRKVHICITIWQIILRATWIKYLKKHRVFSMYLLHESCENFFFIKL